MSTNEEIESRINADFEYLHENPELSYQEKNTTLKIRSELSAAGIKILPLELETGAVAEIGHGDKAVAIRCDIDALPVQEETGLPYQSKVKGVMHACGHDFHTALILGAAMLLKERESELQGRVRCVFQPAEEAPGGARKIIDSGALEGVSAIFGVHTIPLYKPGTLGIREGATHAAVDRFKLVFTGKGTHAAHPNLGIDTLQVAAHYAVAAQSIVSRNSDPFATNLVSITRLEAGNTWNVIPETAILEGTVRTMTPDNREMVKRRLVELADGIAKSFDARADFTWVFGLPPMQNDKGLSDFASDLARSDGFKVERTPSSLGGEDFALYEEHIPGAFVQVGTGPSLPNHNPRFVADRKALFPAARFMAHLASEYLRRF